MKNQNVRNSGIGFFSVLTLIFIVLKLTNNISWFWAWILSPIWITAVLLIVIFAFIMIVGRIKRGNGNKKLQFFALSKIYYNTKVIRAIFKYFKL